MRMVADDLVLVPLVTMDDHGLIGGGPQVRSSFKRWYYLKDLYIVISNVFIIVCNNKMAS